jgi:hypothetical protein
MADEAVIAPLTPRCSTSVKPRPSVTSAKAPRTRGSSWLPVADNVIWFATGVVAGGGWLATGDDAAWVAGASGFVAVVGVVAGGGWLATGDDAAWVAGEGRAAAPPPLDEHPATSRNPSSNAAATHPDADVWLRRRSRRLAPVPPQGRMLCAVRRTVPRGPPRARHS